MIKVTPTGFSLIELVITLLVIAILTTSAIVTFQVPAVKSQQVAAKLDLLNLAASMEKCREEKNNYYYCSLKELNYQPIGAAYDYAIQSQTNSTYKLTATPRHRSIFDNCETFILDQDGNKYISGNDHTQDCW
jgi:prepilin-type N-terminal cleavage/methylation domain-containing protein